MSEYWKSNAKKFCDICKCWFADNKISIENHERGLRHKGMVQQRLREISQKADEEDRANNQLAATLAQMEQAAARSMSGKSKNSGFSNFKIDGATIGPSIGASVYADGGRTVAPVVEKLTEYEKQKKKVRDERERMRALKRTAKQSTVWKDDEEDVAAAAVDNQASYQQVEAEIAHVATREDEIQWVKAVDNGKEYYFNINTGDTSWTCPGKFYTMAEYEQYYSQHHFASSSEAYQQYSDYSQQFYSTEAAPVPPDVSGFLDDSTPAKRAKTVEGTRYETERDDIEEQTNVSKPETISIFEPEPDVADEVEEQKPQKFVGLLGPWTPVVRQEKKPVIREEKIKELLDDLPEEAKLVKNLEPTFDELEAAELTFGEKVAPVTVKSKKVIEFKKRKTGTTKSIRTREEQS